MHGFANNLGTSDTTSTSPHHNKTKKVRSLLPKHHSQRGLMMKVCYHSSIFLTSAPGLIKMYGQREVRNFAGYLLKREDKASDFPLLSSKEFKRFEAQNTGGPTRKNFRVQLVGSLACKWNHRAADVFASAYIKEKGTLFKHEDLVACFKVHLRTLKNQYKCITDGAGASLADVERRSANAQRMRRQGVSVPHTVLS